MHILLIHQAFASIAEAGGTRHHEFARQMQRRGHKVSVITGRVSYLTGAPVRPIRDDAQLFDDRGVTIIRCASYGGWHRSFIHRVLSFLSFMWTSFWAAMRVRKVDLVWGTTPPIFQALTARWVARFKRVPYVLEVRDLWPYFAVEIGVLTNPLIIALAEWLEGYLYRTATTVIVNSPGYEDHVRSRGAVQVGVVPNGVDPQMITLDAPGSGLRTKLGIDPQAFVVMYTGAHGISNDLGVVLRAAELLGNESSIGFVLIGDGKEKPKLQKLVEEKRLGNVYFHPPVPKREIAACLVEADAGLAVLKDIPAYRLTYPNKVFDYMAAGLPVFCMIDGEIRKVVERSNAGVFIQPGNAEALAGVVREWQGRHAELASMGKRGREHVSEYYDRGALADQMLEIMQSASLFAGETHPRSRADMDSGK